MIGEEEERVKMNSLPKVVTRRLKRVGRGYGSGKGGHTSGRGQKGQKSRAKINILFEGLKVKKSLIKKLPLVRGKAKMHSPIGPVTVKLGLLNSLPASSVVDIDTLIKNGLVDASRAKKQGVKILGGGVITKKLTIKLPISASAIKKVEKAGGKVLAE